MEGPRSRRAPPRGRVGLARGALGLAVAGLGGFALWRTADLAAVFWGRFDYPMDLEWMEGGQLYQAHRLLRGEPVYGDCSDGFVPFAYPPGHMLALAAFGALFGLDYALARLVSIGACLGSCAVLGWQAGRVARSPLERFLLAVVAVGGIAAAYPVVGGWYDLVRVDSLYALLLLSGAALSLPAPGRAGLAAGRLLAAAALLSAAVYTKQSAALFLPWIVLYATRRHPPNGVALGAAVVAISAAVLLPLLWATEGRFWTYAVRVLSRQTMAATLSLAALDRITWFAPYWWLLPLAALALWRRRALSGRTAFWIGMLLSGVATSVLTSAKVGGYHNNLIPALMLAPPAALMLASDLFSALGRGRPRGDLAMAAAAGLATLWYAQVPRGHPDLVPGPDAWRAARSFNRLVASLEGGALVPAHPFVPIRNGQPGPQVHEQAYMDLIRARLPIDAGACLRSLDAGWLVLDRTPQEPFAGLVTRGYEPVLRLPERMRRTHTIPTRPDRLYRRRGAPP